MFVIVLFLVILIPFILNLIFTPVVIRISDKNNWYDYYDAEQKIHKFKTSRLGGIGIFCSFFLAIFIFPIILPLVSDWSFAIFTKHNLIYFIGLLVIFIIGLVDDFRNISPLHKFLGQILSAIIITFAGTLVDGIYIPILQYIIPLGFLGGAIIIIIWVISLSNAVNIIDGMDGHAGIITICASIAIGISHFMVGNITGAIFSFTLTGSLLAFLIFNKPVAKIFMGDSGALFLGFILAILVFVGSEVHQEINPIYFQSGFVLCISLLIIPVADTITAIIRRTRNKRPIYQPDNLRYYHILMKLGVSEWKILFIPIIVGLILIGLATLRVHFLFQDKLILGDILMITMWIIISIFLFAISYINKHRKE